MLKRAHLETSKLSSKSLRRFGKDLMQTYIECVVWQLILAVLGGTQVSNDHERDSACRTELHIKNQRLSLQFRHSRYPHDYYSNAITHGRTL